jgi:hypothetical protein
MHGLFAARYAPRKRIFLGAGRGGRWASALLLLACCCMHSIPAATRILEVGPTRKLTTLDLAAAEAKDGDRVVIDPGVYRNCAIWTASGLTIEARRPPSSMNRTVMTETIVTGPVCADRGLFVFTGDNITVRGLSFQHARDSWHTGAGVLMEGSNLIVEDSGFLDDENGILAGGSPASVVRVRHVLFNGDGSCAGSCAHALYAGKPIARLEVVACLFLDTHVGHSIKSRAHMTVVRDTRIEDGATGTSSYLIELPDGGDAEIVNNVLEKGIHSENKDAAISIGTEDQRNPTRELVIRGNHFTNDLPDPVRFVRNTTPAMARLADNTLVGSVIPLDGPGTVTAVGQ